MNSEFKSKIEVDEKTGQKCLIVFYNSESDDFEEAINQAVAFHNIRDGQMNVIALPGNSNKGDGISKWKSWY